MLTVAAIQLRTSVSRSDTLFRASRLIGEAAKSGARLCVLPEAFTGMYGVDHFVGNAEQIKGAESGTKMMSEEAASHGIFVCGGVIEQHPIKKSVLHNTIVAYGPSGQEVARYRKVHLSRVSLGKDTTCESSVLQAGDKLSWFDIDDDSESADGRGWRVGLASCFDLRFREFSDMLSRDPPNGIGAELLVYPSAWLKSTGDMGHWEVLLKARALDAQIYAMGVNVAHDASQDTATFGRSCVVGPLGETIAVCGDDNADEVVLAKLSLDHLKTARKSIPLSDCRRPLVYQDALRSAQSTPLAMMRPPLGCKDY